MHTTIFLGMMNDGENHVEAPQQVSTLIEHNQVSSALSTFSWCLGTSYGWHHNSVAFLQSSK
jgi:hypothetical protein